MSTKSAIVKAIIENSGSKVLSVTFKKLTNGELRTIAFNPREGGKLVTGERAEATKTRKDNNPDIVNVVDASIANREADRRGGWRSFNCNTVVSIKTGGEEIIFKE